MTILLLYEPDGTRAIDISSRETYQKVALAIVKARMDLGYYPEPVEPPKPDLTINQVKELPAGKFREFGQGMWQLYRDDLKKWKRQRESWDHIKGCLDSQDGEAAIAVLESRKDFEGENFQVMEVNVSY